MSFEAVMASQLLKLLEQRVAEAKGSININYRDVDILKEWFRKQPHFPQVEEPFLTALMGIYLHACYNRIEQSKVAIDNGLTLRTICPDKFDAPSEDIVRLALGTVSCLTVLPKRTKDDYRIFVGKVMPQTSEHFVLVNHTRCLEMVISLDYIQKGLSDGIVIIFDMKDFTFGHLARFNLGVVKAFLFYVQEAVPIRLKAIHLVNMVPFADKAIALVKPFMKKELYDTLIFHPNSLDSLYEHVPKDCLPEDYDGDLPPLSELNKVSMENLLENMEFFRWLGTKKSDESKRPEPTKLKESVFGMDGTFKKLDID